jgi:heme/copper-type cytochrome/quinol oxidase subunit 2
LLSIAGRNPLSWRWFVPLVVLWLGSVGLSLGQTHVRAHHPDEVNCYVFMMAVSAPMVVLVIGYLRRTRALYPLRTLAVAGAGVAMALTLLSFAGSR